jgi:lipopolysaccharide/colanic/teichoic acid biosynthesis glycosyltransferase
MVKRLFDIAVACAGLAILGPLFILIAILIKLSSPGPIFYRGARVGKNGQVFHIFKFRSMVTNAPATGPAITARDDPRVTRIGRFLRKTKLDEIPQLVNVLRGEMSIVGPRPEDPRYVALYTPRQKHVLSVRPGITSPASIQYRNEEAILSRGSLDEMYINTVMPEKLELDLAYIENISLWADLKIILMTIKAVFHTDPRDKA